MNLVDNAAGRNIYLEEKNRTKQKDAYIWKYY